MSLQKAHPQAPKTKMVNEYVKDDIRDGSSFVNHDFDSDEEYHDEPMSFLEWENYYADDIHNMWWELKSYLDRTGASLYMLQGRDYMSFAEYCWNNSSGYRYRPAVGH